MAFNIIKQHSVFLYNTILLHLCSYSITFLFQALLVGYSYAVIELSVPTFIVPES